MNNILSRYIAENINGDTNLSENDMINYNIKKFNETIEQSKKSDFYSKKLKDIKNIKYLKAIENIPFTSEDEIRENYKKMLCVSIGDVERIVHINTSGSTGKSKTIFFSKKDLEYTISFFRYGLSQFSEKNDKMLILMPFKNENSVGDLVAKAVCQYGVKPLKYGIVKNFDHALESLKISDSIVGDPVQIQALARYMKFHNINIKLKGILTSSDFILKKTVLEIEDAFQCKVYNHYGLTETAYGGAVECDCHSGMHPRENDIYLEIIDPFSGKIVKDGDFGEIVITTFNREAMPLIRYKTGDRGRFLKKRCACSINLKCLDYISGRIKREKDRFNIYKMDGLIFADKTVLDYKFEASADSADISLITFSPESINKNDIEKIIRQNFITDNLNINIKTFLPDEINYSEFHNGKRKIHNI